MRTRTWPVLTTGFGILLLMIALLGYGIARRSQQINTEVSKANKAYQQTEEILSAVRSDIYISGILTRDYLLDPSHLTASSHREQLLEIRKLTAQRLKELERLISADQAGLLRSLGLVMDPYWDSLDPIFEWSPAQKTALSALFLRQQVLPRRQAVLSIAREIRSLNQANYQQEQGKILGSQREFHAYLRSMVLWALLLGLLVAGASIYRVSRLERRAEEHRRETEEAEEELRRLSQQLVRIQEDERRSISRELHDQVGQMLTAIRMEIGNLEQLRGADERLFLQHLEGARTIAAEALQVVRNLAMGLRPSMLDDLGLGPALEWQAREFSRRSGIPVSLEVDGLLEDLPDPHRTCIYRVVQEALTNCARHSKAQNVRITFHADRERLSLTIQDDGVGLSSHPATLKGLGLIGIEERVRELGGRVTIVSQPQKGTLLQVDVPQWKEQSA
jgi:signal transduction histidine kinase